MRTFPDPDHVLLPRDHLTVWVPAVAWTCEFCTPNGGEGAGTTVDWIQGPDGKEFGRCRECGLKLRCAEPFDRVPTVREQLQLLGALDG